MHCYIYFHQGFTDIINCIPLAKYYATKYDRVTVILRDDVKPMFDFFIRDTDNIVGDYDNKYVLDNLFNVKYQHLLGNGDAILLFFGYHDAYRRDAYQYAFYTSGKGENFLESFYLAYDIDYEVRINYFSFIRDFESENLFYDKINPGNNDYVLIHEDTKRDILIDKSNMSTSTKIINLDNISNILFDTIKLIENAKEIHCIDSIWLVFIYLLDAKYNLLGNKNIKVFAHCLRGYVFFVNNPHLSNWTIVY